MNYDAFMEPVTWFLTGMQKHSDEFRQDMLGNADNFFGAMHHNMSRMGGQAYAISMNELSNHDHSLPGYGVDEFQIFGMQIKAFCLPSIKLVSYDRAV